MASVVFNSGLADALRGTINFGKDKFKVMLCTADYVPNKDEHSRRSDITNEVSGEEYIEGGTSADVSVTNDTVNDWIDVSLGEAKWVRATIKSRIAVYYKSRGGSPSADELIAAIDFGKDVVSTNGEFSLTPSILRIKNW